MKRSSLIAPLIAVALDNMRGLHGGRYVPQLSRPKRDEAAMLKEAEAKRQRKNNRRAVPSK